MQSTDIDHTSQNGRDHDQQPLRQDQRDDEQEWEYEYDEDDTEDYYFTIDLTTHVPDALTKQPTAASNGKQTKGILDLRLREYKRQSRQSSPSPADPNFTLPTSGPSDESREEALEFTEPSSEQNGTNEQPVDVPDSTPGPPPPAGTMQIVGLHTTTPYLLFNNNFYTSYWFTDLGTQIWVSASGVTDAPTWSGHVLDVVGSSQVRLLAKPAKLQPKYDDHAVETGRSTSNVPTADTLNDPVDLTDTEKGPQQIIIPRTTTSDPALNTQASFMERLSALKIKKGEHDQMPMYSVKSYEYPANAADIRAQSWAAVEQERAAAAATSAASTNKTQASSSRLSASSPPSQRIRRTASAQSRLRVLESADTATPVPEEAEDEHLGDDDPQRMAQEPNMFFADGSAATETRGRKKRSAKLAGLGLASQETEPQTSPKVKRTRRTKAEMAEYRRELEAARIAKEMWRT